MNEIFRHFFGFNNPKLYHPRLPNENDGGVGEGDKQDLNGPSMSHEPINDMFRHFENMFRNFGLQEFNHQFDQGLGDDSLDKPSATNPRDEMLKNPKSFSNEIQPLKTDTDLDAHYRSNGLQGILDEFPSRTPFAESFWKTTPSSSSFFRSVSISTKRTEDGKYEEHRIVKDGNGTTKTTVKRILGDQSHIVTLVKDKDGIREKKEEFGNLDENSINNFNSKWSTGETNNYENREQICEQRDPTFSAIKRILGL